MYETDIRLAALAAAKRGIVTREWALAAGVSDAALRRRVELGSLVAVHPGVYRHAAVPLTSEARWLAAVTAAGPHALLSHRAAATLHGLEGVRRSRPEVTAPFSRLPVLEGVTVHRSRKLDPLDRVVVRGIPATTPARTLLDLCALLPFDVVQEATHVAVIRRLVTHAELLAVGERVAGRGKSGSTAFRQILLGGLPDDSIESMLELRLARIIEQTPLPPAVRQFELTCDDGRRVRLDNAWPALRVAAEADGLRWHGTAAQVRATRDRSRSIQGSGWLHLVYGWSDCTETPYLVGRELQTLVGRRRAAA